VTFRVVVPRRANIPEQSRLADEGKSPRHCLGLVAERLKAVIHEPAPETRATHPVASRILPDSALWSLAETVRKAAAPTDSIFCASEAGGFQLAAMYSGKRKRPHIAVFAHNVDRPRTRFAMKWWRLARTVDVFLACSEYQAEFLREYLELSSDRVRFIRDHTDTEFFTPGPSSPKKRPLVVSVGLEQRDYRTLARATSDLDVDVKISGFSKDALPKNTFPDVLPANMDRRYYEWPDLVQLYRSADVIVVSCHENKYAAGVQSLMEGSSCRRPIIATATIGLRSYLNESVVSVRPGDFNEMREAIRLLTRDGRSADDHASRAHDIALERYSMNRYVDDICDAMRKF
jgi:glycosyltransferase involved in cell wall biosynthesis